MIDLLKGRLLANSYIHTVMGAFERHRRARRTLIAHPRVEIVRDWAEPP